VSGGLDSRYASADDSAGLLLWRVTNRWQAAIRAALKPHGLTHVQYVLLASLTWIREHQETPVTQTVLASFAGTDTMMTSQVLRALENRDLVERLANPHDGRARHIRVTEAGAAAARAATADVEAADARFFGPLGDAVPGFAAALRTLTRA